MRYLILLLIAAVVSGCSPEVRPTVVTETHTSLDTDSLTHLIKAMMAERSSAREKETVHVFDKTTYTVNTDGDTVGKERERVTDRNREWESKEARYLHVIDSLMHARNRADSTAVPAPYPVERELTRWERAKMDFGGWAMVGLIVAAVAVVWLVFKKRRR